MNSVAVVTPLYRQALTYDENLSRCHLQHFLADFDRFILVPDGLEVEWPGFQKRIFDSRFFTSIAAYSQLLLTRQFYETFAGYEYILIYQLDGLVLSNQLDRWCATGFDYLGAPWFGVKGDTSSGFSRVGNGGLSLRKVESFLTVIESRRYVEEKVPFWRDYYSVTLPDYLLWPWPGRLLKKLRVMRAARHGSQWYRTHYTINEDHFWSDRARLFYPQFQIAPVDVGLQFAFEQFPRVCFRHNGYQLPFGVHAWAKWDRDFWEPYLLTI